MADFTLSSADYIRPYRSPWGQCEIRKGLESTTQSFVYGAVLALDKATSTCAHRVAQALVSASTVTSTSIVGVALQAASSIVDGTVPYASAAPHNEFWGRTRGGLLAETNVGASFGLFKDSTKNIYGVDLANSQSTSQRVIITELIDQIGDSGGAVLFKFGCPNGSTNTFGAAFAR